MVPRLSLGVEYNPRGDDSSALANLVAMTETARRPALIFGTSSDRIGTPDGQAYYATLSKALDPLIGWPVTPYVGVSYGTYENDTRMIGGLNLGIPETGISSTLIHDGKNFHPTVEYRFLDRHVLSLLWVDTEEVGVAYNVAF